MRHRKMKKIVRAAVRWPLTLAAVFVFACAPSPEDIRAQIDNLGDPLTETTKAAQKKLGAMGKAVIPEIAALCRDVEDPVAFSRALQRRSACIILGTALGNEPEAAALLIELTDSRDGVLRKSAIYHLRGVWGGEVEKELSAKIVDTLYGIMREGAGKECRVYEYDPANEKAGTEWLGSAFVFHDFDVAAVETLAVMYSVQKEMAPSWGLLCGKTLEKALLFPRVQEQARAALEKK
ncbi:MAG: hypothetical protein JXD23_02310 [Spirochaetales bacterium]|nr:hypothetical protein [Spirochaetales bacterium]